MKKHWYYTKNYWKNFVLYQNYGKNFGTIPNTMKLWLIMEKTYGTMGKNYGIIPKIEKKTKLLWNTLWYFNKLLLTIWTIVYYSTGYLYPLFLHGFASAMDTRLLSLYKVTAEANMYRVNTYTYIIKYTFYIMIISNPYTHVPFYDQTMSIYLKSLNFLLMYVFIATTSRETSIQHWTNISVW